VEELSARRRSWMAMGGSHQAEIDQIKQLLDS
jgi:hypothetical protein